MTTTLPIDERRAALAQRYNAATVELARLRALEATLAERQAAALLAADFTLADETAAELVDVRAQMPVTAAEVQTLDLAGRNLAAQAQRETWTTELAGLEFQRTQAVAAQTEHIATARATLHAMHTALVTAQVLHEQIRAIERDADQRRLELGEIREVDRYRNTSSIWGNEVATRARNLHAPLAEVDAIRRQLGEVV